MNTDPGGLTIVIDDRSVDVVMTGGGSWTLPLGPVTLVASELADGDPPSPESLTNALGAVQDHFDDVLIEAPIVASTPSVDLVGRHALALARLELGSDDVPTGYTLRRSDADEVFRTIVAEPTAERIHNPGLDRADVETIVGTCCVVLAIMRRLDIHCVGIDATKKVA
jgi:exopolyphosphatase/pppGpp-phosphohydrolase